MKKATAETSLSVWHTALLLAIVYIAVESGCTEQIYITRRKLMQRSRIGSIVTYHKYMQELVEKSYILYFPSYHPKKGSLVILNIVWDPRQCSSGLNSGFIQISGKCPGELSGKISSLRLNPDIQQSFD